MTADEVLGKQEVVSIYRKRAKRYDLTANLYHLIGVRESKYRERAVDALALQRGDTVVEIGCGTGLNFSRLMEAVGPEGRIIGVDLTDAMLEEARRRVIDRGWSNVDLVRADAAIFAFPQEVGGILSTFALTLVPEYDLVIHRGSQALTRGRRWVVLDFKLPANALARLAPVLALLTRPFGVRLAMANRHPWESINRHLQSTRMVELYGGFLYIAVGERGVEQMSV